MKNFKKKLFDNYFLTSRNNNNTYRFINNFCFNYEKKKYFKNINLKEFEILDKIDIRFIFYIFKLFLFGTFFFKDKISKIEYNNIHIGRYLISSTYRSSKSYSSIFYFYYELLKNVYRSSKIFYSIKFYSKNFQIRSFYLEHCYYLNGIIYDYFYKRKIRIYSNHYPHNIFLIKPKTKYKNYSEYLKIPYFNKKLLNSSNTIKNVNKIFNNFTKHNPYMDETKYLRANKNFFNNIKKFDYIIYPHSFTDAQLIYGYDGFSNSYDWLDFTLKELNKTNKKVLIKSHPNFYLKSHPIFEWDRKIYKKIIDKYSFNKNFLFVQIPIKNSDIKKFVRKDAVIITRYGTVEIEMSFYNFKIISSKKSFFSEKYKISNKWNNKNEYEILLHKDWKDLRFSNKNDTLNVCNKLYFNSGYFEKNFYLNILKSKMIKNKQISKYDKYNEIMEKFNKILNPSILKMKLALDIEEFN